MHTRLFFLSTFFAILLSCAGASAQSREADSLKKVLTGKADTSQFAAYKRMCWIYLNRASFDTAETWADRFYAAGEELESDRFKAEALYMKGISLARRGGHDPEAVEVQTRAMQLYEREGNLSGQGFTNLMIGYVYYNQHNNSTAKIYWLRSREYFTEANDEGGLANSYVNLGVIEAADSNFTAAENLFQQALSIFRGRRSVGGVSTCLDELAHVKMVQFETTTDSAAKKRYADAAYEFLTEAIAHRRRGGDEDGIVDDWAALCRYYIKTGKADSAMIYADSVMVAGLAHGAKDNTRDAYMLFADIYRLKGDYEKAYNFLVKGEDLDDSLRGSESANRTAAVIAEYEAQRVREQVENDQRVSRLVMIAVGGGLILTIALCIVAFRAYRRSKSFSAKLAAQNEIITQKNADITDSIQYSKRIQEALLPDAKQIRAVLGHAFVFYKPKDIISGDFYWIQERDEKVFFMAADCTGHGVPGALMSMISSTLLNESVLEKHLTEAGAILDDVRTGIIRSLRQQGDSGEDRTKDGMDGALCVFDRKSRTLSFAGAYNPLWIVRNGELIEVKADKFPVGISGAELLPFQTQHVDVRSGDMLYVFTDGYADQFGGGNGKKLKYSGFRELLISISALAEDEQQRRLENHFNGWKGKLEQVDDACVIGVRID